MFTVIYQFNVKEGQSAPFIESWEKLTILIYQFEGSLGSRLHQVKEHEFLAYAQWPDCETWQQSGKKLPPKAEAYRAQMKAACENIQTIHEASVVRDLLRLNPHG